RPWITALAFGSGRNHLVARLRAIVGGAGTFADDFSACCLAALRCAIARCVFAIWTSLPLRGGAALPGARRRWCGSRRCRCALSFIEGVLADAEPENSRRSRPIRN